MSWLGLDPTLVIHVLERPDQISEPMYLGHT
jgi:hypothetical protein